MDGVSSEKCLSINCLAFYSMPKFNILYRPAGSDCGIVNINIPTSGAEIGGAFGMFPLEVY